MKSTYIEFTDTGVVNVRRETVDTSDLGPWEAVIRNEASLVSAGTELAALHAIEQDITYPRKTGYASIGRIEKKGEAITDFEIGDRVFYAGKHASVQRATHGENHQWGRFYPVPDGIASEDAVFACLAEIAMIAPHVSAIDIGDTVAVFGLGVIGNIAAQLYQIAGAKVIALDPVGKRCELARESGIDTVLDLKPGEQLEAIMERTAGKGADITVDAAGHSAVIQQCLKATRLFGQAILLGTPRAPYEGNMSESFRLIHQKGLVVRGAHQWRLLAADAREVKHSVAWAFRTMFDLIGSGTLHVAPLRSHVVTPDQAPQAYTGLSSDRNNYWGVVFDWRDA